MYIIYCRVVQFFVKIFYYFIKYPNPKVINHPEAIKELPDLIKENKLTKPLIVTDNFLFNSGLLDPLFKAFKEANVSYCIFSDVVSNPTIKNVLEGYEKYKSEGCDCLIAVGGGSPMDTAKMIGAKASNPKKSLKKFLGLFTVRKPLPLFFAVPTTAGTGSEATIAAVITDEETSHKVPVIDPKLMPHYAILDPTLTIGLPPSLTATTGLDALCHSVEAYTNWKYLTKTEKELAKKSVKLIYENLYECYLNPTNLKARENMQLAALYAGRSFSRGSVGYVHAIGHTLGGLYHIPHGLAMSVILPYVLKAYGTKVHKRLSELADVVGIEGSCYHCKAKAFISWIEDINKKMNIPTGFNEIKQDDIDQIVKWAIKESNPVYPCPQVWNKKKFRTLVESLQRSGN